MNWEGRAGDCFIRAMRLEMADACARVSSLAISKCIFLWGFLIYMPADIPIVSKMFTWQIPQLCSIARDTIRDSVEREGQEYT